ncbi:MAG: hypothetical protein ACI4NE_08020 [Succinivibrio sp.]
MQNYIYTISKLKKYLKCIANYVPVLTLCLYPLCSLAELTGSFHQALSQPVMTTAPGEVQSVSLRDSSDNSLQLAFQRKGALDTTPSASSKKAEFTDVHDLPPCIAVNDRAESPNTISGLKRNGKVADYVMLKGVFIGRADANVFEFMDKNKDALFVDFKELALPDDFTLNAGYFLWGQIERNDKNTVIKALSLSPKIDQVLCK